MKTNLQLLKEMVTGITPADKLTAVLAVLEKHYTQNQRMVDDVMQFNGAKGGFSILKTNVPAFKSEMLNLR